MCTAGASDAALDHEPLRAAVDPAGTLRPVATRARDVTEAVTVRTALAAAYLVLVGALAWPTAVARAAGDPFSILSLESPGRTAFAELVDLDGDRRTDVVAVAFTGLPPNERREVRVYFQRENGGLPAQPDWTAPG